MTADLCWVDGELSDSLPLPDRGLAFGDGLFETVLLSHGRPMLAELHQERLALGLQALGFPPLPLSFAEVLEQAACAAPPGCSALRVSVTRGGGPRGYAPPETAVPRVVAQLFPLSFDPADWQMPVVLGLSSIPLPARPWLAGLKHLNRLEQVMAARECQREQWGEAVMLDADNLAVSVIAGNVFALCEGMLRTPEVGACGVAGTRRRAVLEHWAPALGLPVEEGRLTPDDLATADEIFYCNSLQGIRAVGWFGTRQWTEMPVTRALHACHVNALNAARPA